MTILHLLYAGGIGGIEKLCKDIARHSENTRNIFVFVHEGGYIYEEMKADGADVVLLELNNREIFRLKNELVRITQEQSVDMVVVHHSAPLMWLGTLLYSFGNKGEVIVYAHNNYSEIVSRKKWKAFIYSMLLKKASCVIAISEYVKQSIVSVGCVPADKIKVVYNGVNVEEYKTLNNVRGKETIRLVYVGRLIKSKGVHILIDALSKVSNANHFQLTVVGDGFYKVELEKQTKRLKLEEYITFVGNQRNVQAYLQDADVFVHPAIWEEGFGITIIEAMSAGLVCVAFKKGAIPEIIQSGVNGFIVNECDPYELAKKLDEIYVEIKEDKLNYIRDAAIERAKDFSIEKFIEHLEEIYSIGRKSK